MSKVRTSQCREWEKERRNKFNKAITALGDLIKSIKGKESDMTQLSKIEIIQKAIAFITDNSEDISRLKAQILALQVQLEEITSKEKKDACTQISISAKTKLKSSKYNKSLIIKKCKHNALKEKTILAKVENKNLLPLAAKPNGSQGEVFILPKTTTNTNAQDNTFVVVPATPFVIPQRPLLLPAAPPTFILLNPNNMQAFNNPLRSRTSKDSTKTTMVNVLPISAYSHPLSANKPKRARNVTSKKKIKTQKKTEPPKQSNKENDKTENEKTKSTSNAAVSSETTADKEQSKVKPPIDETPPDKDPSNKTLEIKISERNQCKPVNATPKDVVVLKTISETQVSNTTSITASDIKSNKIETVKEVATPEEKPSKMPSILDTSLCENTVDGGNARLELAEELLAASPTAAFLMSFPLVSGNRADSPVEEAHTVPQIHNDKESVPKRADTLPTQTDSFFPKPQTNTLKEKLKKPETLANSIKQTINVTSNTNKSEQQITNSKKAEVKPLNTSTSISTDSPFLNLQIPTIVSSGCALPDATFALDFDCNISRSLQSQPANYASTNTNLFYKGDTFNNVKSSIYSTSSISSGHDFNSLGLYPCAMEKYSTKNKTDFSNVDENLMKIGSSRLTYDIDLGWSQKSLDFVSCSTSAPTFSKDNLLTSVASSYNSSYNPFNPDFHVPLVGNTNKKDNFSKPSSSFADSISNFYSQTTSLWSEDVPFYTSSGISTSKPPTSKQNNFLQTDHSQAIITTKQSNIKPFDTKQVLDHRVESGIKALVTTMAPQMSDKYTKKSPSKMHINWMTSEIRPSHNICNVHTNNIKEPSRTSTYNQFDYNMKKQDNNESNYFPISVPNHNYPTQVAQEDFTVWPSARPLGTTEISMDPPPINLPTLVGDLALGPHEKKKHAEMYNRVAQPDVQNCNNFLSVTQLMNRSDNMPSRFPVPNIDSSAKPEMVKQNIPYYSSQSNRKSFRIDTGMTNPCYPYNETKSVNTFETTNTFSNSKSKPIKASDKNVKNHKNSYSAEALIRSGSSGSHKVTDNKFIMPSHKFNDYNLQQDSSVAQVSHFPPMIDYSDNNYTSQQFSGTNLYNSTTNTISNTFYTNFMPGSSNLMSSNYTGTPFSGEFIDYSQSTECNYPNQKYEEFKMRGNPPVFHHEKAPNTKTSKREMAAKHKMECSKKDSKRYQSKKVKLNAEAAEDWADNANLLWQNKTSMKRPSNVMDDQLSFPNYVGNQMATQYQPEIFNNHLMPNVQGVGHHVDRSLASFPPTSRANFNLSTIFPEITMKVQT